MKNEIILVAARSPELADKIKGVLEQEFFNITDTCVSGSETLRKVRMYKPDLIVLDYEMGDMTGFQITEVVINESLGSVILLANQMQKDYAEQYFEYPYMISLRKPINKAVLLNSVEIALKSRRGIQSLENEISRLKEDIETRKSVEKAKGILMKSLGISEDEAYQRLRKRSMDSQVPMKTVADIIISTMG
ncbi:MAG TPA: ANTAR domain-containing protein [Clostridia bacterium]|jgi:response regulator NasT|nr:ANTAR domain-containing protein [Clostridia bacterium]HPQ47110.1 ANTAR domain-containing protein [Clostridia bacterium]HRX41386.1 ANTAR domain-containing protein [Clostridia bacterium]